jgi:hypothetical protein
VTSLARHLATIAALVTPPAGLAACGGSVSEHVAVTVGSVAIAKSTVDHWASVMAAEHPVSKEAPRQRALDFLISSEWTVGQAAEQGLRVSGSEVRRRLGERVKAFANGEAEFRELLEATGETVADVTLEIEAELASAKLYGALIAHEPKPTPAEIAGYFQKHRRDFVDGEQRKVEVLHTEDRAVAERIFKEVEAGRALTSEPQAESLVYNKGLGGAVDKTRVAKAIFAARAPAPAGAVREARTYFIFELKRIVPPVQMTFAEVRGSIEQQLLDEQRSRAIADFLAAWREQWTAKTDCAPGFLVAGCRQFPASNGAPAENPFTHADGT